MEDDKSDSLKKNESKINQHLEKIKSGLEITGKKVIDSSSKAVDATSKWTSDLTGKAIEKKDEIIENRQRKRDEFVESLREDEKYKKIILEHEKLPPMVTILAEVHEKLIQDIQKLEDEVKELELKVENNIGIVNSDYETEEKQSEIEELGLGGEVNRSINQILLILVFSTLWAVILIVIDFQLKDRNISFSGLSTTAVVWTLGTAIWTLFLLSSQSEAGTLLSMEWSNRIKTSIGVGLATTLSLMLTDGEMKAITNVWGWSMTIALCAFLLSGLFRAVFSSIRNVKKWIKPKAN